MLSIFRNFDFKNVFMLEEGLFWPDTLVLHVDCAVEKI